MTHRTRITAGLAVHACALLAGRSARAEPMEHVMAEAHDTAPAAPLGLEDPRDASGTSWQPASTPMFMWHARAGGWALGLHTSAFFGYDRKGSDRGDDQLVSINWIMGMASRPLGAGELALRAMLSAEPATMPEDGYPLLLQTGESANGEPLHDRQHPHDLFMELAARFRHPISDAVGVELYAAPVGEPAIGPTAFPHRFTAMADPLAPLGHHWLDSTHITFGVLTAGVVTSRMKLEASWFNGREPDEDRWDFDLRRFDSAAARLSYQASRDLTAQLSWARLDSPEATEPEVSVHRFTASATWNRRLANGVDDVAITAAFGHNQPSEGRATSAGLAEGTLMLEDTHSLFGRVELLAKTGEELVLPDEMAGTTYGIASFSAGYIRDLDPGGPVVVGVGAVGTLDVIGAELEPFYGTRVPVGGMVFVRLRPPTMSHGSHGSHGR